MTSVLTAFQEGRRWRRLWHQNCKGVGRALGRRLTCVRFRPLYGLAFCEGWIALFQITKASVYMLADKHFVKLEERPNQVYFTLVWSSHILTENDGSECMNESSKDGTIQRFKSTNL